MYRKREDKNITELKMKHKVNPIGYNFGYLRFDWTVMGVEIGELVCPQLRAMEASTRHHDTYMVS